MNIFILDKDPEIAATYLMDKHVVKMALETAQILSTINDGPYKRTHEGHPCVLWAGSCIGNYTWLTRHGLAICKEYTYRYDKVHKCEEVIQFLKEPYEKILPTGFTDFVQCVPTLFRCNNAVLAYREYYATKASFAKWTKRGTPDWWMK